MLLADALKLLKEGKQVRRATWSEEEGYLTLMKGMKHVWKIITKPGPNAGNHIFSYDELVAEDWKEYDEADFAEKDANLEDAAQVLEVLKPTLTTERQSVT